MSYGIGDLRRWDTGGLTTASGAVATRESAAEDARRILSDGREALDEGWDGRAADAVLDAADAEKTHVTKLADGLHDLVDALARAQAALAPAVQTVRDRIADAEFAGLVVGDTSVAPAPGRSDIAQFTVDEHAAAIRAAIDTVVSLDEHYGREIDAVAEMLHAAIPADVDRTPIPGPDDPWPGQAVDAMTGGLDRGLPQLADEIDPATRGAHAIPNGPPVQTAEVAKGLRRLGKIAGPLGTGLTVYGGVEEYATGKSSLPEAAVETSFALGGGLAGGAAAGAAAGMWIGPLGAVVGAGIGAAVGSYLAKEGSSLAYDELVRGER